MIKRKFKLFVNKIIQSDLYLNIIASKVNSIKKLISKISILALNKLKSNI